MNHKSHLHNMLVEFNMRGVASVHSGGIHSHHSAINRSHPPHPPHPPHSLPPLPRPRLDPPPPLCKVHQRLLVSGESHAPGGPKSALSLPTTGVR